MFVASCLVVICVAVYAELWMGGNLIFGWNKKLFQYILFDATRNRM